MARYKVPSQAASGADSFSDDLVGRQITEGSSLMTGTNFTIEKTIPERDTKEFRTQPFSDFLTLDDIVDEKNTIDGTEETKKEIKFNNDKKNATRSLYGSLKQRIGVSITNIITKYPAAIQVDSTLAGVNNYSAENIVYSNQTNTTEFNVLYTLIYNPLEVVLKTPKSSVLPETDNNIRNFYSSYTKYVLDLDGTTYNIISYSEPNSSNRITLRVDGNCFSGYSAYTGNYLIRPNDGIVENFYDQLDDLERVLVNRDSSPKFNAAFNVPRDTNDGSSTETVMVYVNWPISDDGWNIEVVGLSYEYYIDRISSLAEEVDNYKSNLIVRFLTSAQLYEFDTDDKKIESIFQIYGQSFDSVKKFIDNIAYMRNVTYDGINNVPDILLKNLAETLGLSTINLFTEKTLEESLYTRHDTQYDGVSLGTNLIEAEYEFYRRLLVNLAFLFKSKGTRTAIEFFLKFIGAPEPMIRLDEYIYKVDGTLPSQTVENDIRDAIQGQVLSNVMTWDDLVSGYTLTQFTGTTTLTRDEYPVDEDTGLPRGIEYSDGSMFFQKGAGWYKQTLYHRSSDIIDYENSNLTGRTKVIKTKPKPFTYGEDYFDVYRQLPGLNYGYSLTPDIDNEKTELVEDEATSRLTLNRKNINVFLSADRAIDYDIYRKSRDLMLTFGSLTPQTGVTFAEFLSNSTNDIITNSHVIKYQNTYDSLLRVYWAYQSQILFTPYNYISVTEFINRLSPYWIDIIEQFIPATTLWLGGNLIENSIFNRSKYKHKRPMGPTAYIEVLYPDFETVIVEDLRTFLGGGTVDGVSYESYFRGLTSFSGVSYLIALEINGTVYSEQTSNLKTFTGFTPTSSCTRLTTDTETIPLICDYEGSTLFSDVDAIENMRNEWKDIVDALVSEINNDENSDYLITAVYCTNPDGTEYVAFTVTPKDNARTVESFDYYFTPSYVLSHDGTNMEARVVPVNTLVFSGSNICELYTDINIITNNGYEPTIVGDESGNSMPAYIQSDCLEPINIIPWESGCTYSITNFTETNSLDLILSDAANTEVHMKINGLQYVITEWEGGLTGFTAWPKVEYRPSYDYGIKKGTYVLKVVNGSAPTTYQELEVAITNGDIVEEIVDNIISGDTLLSMTLKSSSELTASQFQSAPINGYQFAFDYRIVHVEDIVCFSSVKTYLINNEFKVLPTSKVLVYSVIECVQPAFLFKYPEDLYVSTTGSTSTEYLITETGFPIEITSVEFTNCDVHDIYYHLNTYEDTTNVILFDGMSVGDDKIIVSYVEEEISILDFELHQYCIDLPHGIDEDNIINTQTERPSTFTGWCYNGVEPTPSATPTQTPSITPTPALSSTPSISLSNTPSITPTITLSTSPSLSFSISISTTPSISLSRTPSTSIIFSPTPTVSISSTVTPSISMSITPSISISRTLSPSITPSISISRTPGASPSTTISATPSITPSISFSRTPSITPSISFSRTPSITPSISFSRTPSITPSISFSRTPTITPSISFSRTPSITPSISFSRTPTITPSISFSRTPSISVPMYFACSTFDLGFDEVSGGSFLTAGELTGTTTPTDYLIEWRMNSNTGTVAFTSGSRYEYDASIQREHPFYNEVVEASTLYPVIRKITIGGNTYTPTYESGYRLSPDLLTCLPSQVISSITCDTVYGLDSAGVYPFNLIYQNATDRGVNKSRSFTYQLSNDTKYMAVEFNGFDVSEQLKIYYCTLSNPTGTLIENWIHGRYYTGSTYLFYYTYAQPSIYTGGTAQNSGLYPINYPVNPRIAYMFYTNCNPLRFVFKMTDFVWASGDYLRFEITGSVFEPSVINTNWNLRLDCVNELDMSCTFNLNSDVSKLNSTPVMVYSGGSDCYYEVQYNTLSTYTAPNRALPSTPWMHKYITPHNYTSSFSAGEFNTNPVRIRAPWKIASNLPILISNAGFDSCMNLAAGQTITVTKDETSITFAFSDIADFNDAQSDYSTITGSTAWATWSSYSDTDENYYGYYRIQTRIATSCGDDYTNRDWYFFRTAPVVFNSVNRTMTIEFVIPTNNITPGECDDTYNEVQNRIGTLINTKNYVIPGGTIVTSCRYQGLMYVWYVNSYTSQSNPTPDRYYVTQIEDVFVNGLCDLSVYGFCEGVNTAYPTSWALYRHFDRIRFIDASTHETRMNTWCLERKIGLRTDDCNDYGTDDWETVYCATAPSPSPSPTVFWYNVDRYSCSLGTCGSILSNNNIQTSVALEVGKWYVETESSVVFNVLSVTTFGIPLTPMSGPYDTCSSACALPTPTPSITPSRTPSRTPSVTPSSVITRFDIYNNAPVGGPSITNITVAGISLGTGTIPPGGSMLNVVSPVGPSNFTTVVYTTTITSGTYSITVLDSIPTSFCQDLIPGSTSYPFYGTETNQYNDNVITLSNTLCPAPTPSISVSKSLTPTRTPSISVSRTPGLTLTPTPSLIPDQISIDPNLITYDTYGLPWINGHTTVTCGLLEDWTAEIIDDSDSIINSFTTFGSNSDTCQVSVFPNELNNNTSTATIRLTYRTAFVDLTICRDGFLEVCGG